MRACHSLPLSARYAMPPSTPSPTPSSGPSPQPLPRLPIAPSTAGTQAPLNEPYSTHCLRCQYRNAGRSSTAGHADTSQSNAATRSCPAGPKLLQALSASLGFLTRRPAGLMTILVVLPLNLLAGTDAWTSWSRRWMTSTSGSFAQPNASQSHTPSGGEENYASTLYALLTVCVPLGERSDNRSRVRLSGRVQVSARSFGQSDVHSGHRAWP